MTHPGQPGGVPLPPRLEDGAIALNPQTGELTIDLDRIKRPSNDQSAPWIELQIEVNPDFPLRRINLKGEKLGV